MIGIVPDQIVTESLVEEPTTLDGLAVADAERDLAKIAVIERHLGTGRIGLGFVRGFGLKSGALASTVAHDAHNVVVVGMNDHDMARAVGRLSETGGGVVVTEGRGVRAELPLPVAGPAVDGAARRGARAQPRPASRRRASSAASCHSPFQTMAFLALSVIPSLKITDRGLVDVDRFELVSLEA